MILNTPRAQIYKNLWITAVNKFNCWKSIYLNRFLSIIRTKRNDIKHTWTTFSLSLFSLSGFASHSVTEYFVWDEYITYISNFYRTETFSLLIIIRHNARAQIFQPQWMTHHPNCDSNIYQKSDDILKFVCKIIYFNSMVGYFSACFSKLCKYCHW